ncbi:MAG: glycine--tRNA ligase subunit beta [Betaproteobacteria bacterium]|nr:glycine--tRNA ligase subunit beta [Betaproteobacteria bacterium]
MKQTLLIELLTEELPPKALHRLGEVFKDEVFNGLVHHQLSLGAPQNAVWFATPRRLAVLVREVEAVAPDRTVEEKIMPVSVALDADGKPTPALLKKLEAKGIPSSAIAKFEKRADGKSEAFVYNMPVKGAKLDDVLAGIVADALKKLPITKLMRWGDSEHQFVRPAHALTMLHGSRIVHGDVLGLQSGNVTRGHRFMSGGAVTLKHADDYETVLESEGCVIADFAKRRETIAVQLDRNAEKNDAIWIGHSNMSLRELLVLSNEERSVLSTLLDEVTALVEWPAVYVGEFEEEFLEVPQECLILTMQQHQKYFPLLDANGKLLNKFLIVSNMRVSDPKHIVGGNQRVVRPRLSDARFFYNQDRKYSLESRVEKLGQVVYHNKLGSQLQRVERIETLAGTIARLLKADKADAELAARLSKADLLTDMVGEFPELQGIMGRYYALHDGEKPEVADAIEAHYHPRFAGDTLPQGMLACAVALADKLDTLLGIYGIGQVPTGDKDPFGLRRHALGVLRILIETPLDLPLGALLKTATENFPAGMLSATVASDVEGFMLDRLRGYLRERGFEVTHIEAVLHTLNGRLHEAMPRMEGVRVFAALGVAKDLAAANKRVQNIMRKNREEIDIDFTGTAVKPALLKEAAERDLYQAMQDITPFAQGYLDRGEYGQNLKALVTLKPFIDDFFDKVMVMCEDKDLRLNRALLLQQLGRLMNQVADISKLAA